MFNFEDYRNQNDCVVSTVRGIKKVNVVWKRGGLQLQNHMKKILEQSKLKEDDYAKDLDERGMWNCTSYNTLAQVYDHR